MGGGQEPPDEKQELIEQQPEHADFDTDGHMHGCLFDKYDNNSECNKNCAAWSYALWTRELERSRLTPPLDTEELEKQMAAIRIPGAYIVEHGQSYWSLPENTIKQLLALFAQHTQVTMEEAELGTEIKIHDEYWHSQRAVEGADIGPVALERKEQTEAKLGRLKQRKPNVNNKEAM